MSTFKKFQVTDNIWLHGSLKFQTDGSPLACGNDSIYGNKIFDKTLSGLTLS